MKSSALEEIGEGNMPFKCSKCGKALEKHQCCEYQGRTLCEDCYMDLLSSPQACDPWAVHSAKTFLRGRDRLSALTPLQRKMVDYVKGRGEATIEAIAKNLNVDEEVLRREFAVLRHMEILKATKKGDQILYVLF